MGITARCMFILLFVQGIHAYLSFPTRPFSCNSSVDCGHASACCIVGVDRRRPGSCKTLGMEGDECELNNSHNGTDDVFNSSCPCAEGLFCGHEDRTCRKKKTPCKVNEDCPVDECCDKISKTCVPLLKNGKDAEKKTFSRFLEILLKLEAKFPATSSKDMIHKIRMLVPGFNTWIWKIMYGVNIGFFLGDSIEKFDRTGIEAQLKELKRMLTHDVKNSTNEESGVIEICGETVAFGHVITGVAAGYSPMTWFGMDNLFATTIAGDLGQTALQNKRYGTPLLGPGGKWANGKYTLVGPAGEATFAEINGDIDGFNLGKRVRNNPNQKLSKLFKDYYCDICEKKNTRFKMFEKLTTKATFKSQTLLFTNMFDYKKSGVLKKVIIFAFGRGTLLSTLRQIYIKRISDPAVDAFCKRFGIFQ